MNQHRVPQGTPTGGQYAASTKAESGVALDAKDRYGFLDDGEREGVEALDAEIVLDQAEFDRLKARLTDLRKRRRSILDTAAARAIADQPDDAQVLAMARVSTDAYSEFQDRVRGLHPWMMSVFGYVPADAPQGTRPLYGPSLSLTSGTVRGPLDPDRAEALAAAMVSFARRFCPEPHQVGDHPGWIAASAYTACDARRVAIWYAPDGSEAVLYDHLEHGSDPVARGPLADVLCQMIGTAAADEKERDEAY